MRTPARTAPLCSLSRKRLLLLLLRSLCGIGTLAMPSLFHLRRACALVRMRRAMADADPCQALCTCTGFLRWIDIRCRTPHVLSAWQCTCIRGNTPHMHTAWWPLHRALAKPVALCTATEESAGEGSH
jgi:hypothetical protein